MDRKLFIQALTKFFAGLLAFGVLLFLPAGTFRYPQGWLLTGILFVPMFAAGLVMMKKNPDLLRKRLNAKEEESEQKTVILFSGIMFLAAFILATFPERWKCRKIRRSSIPDCTASSVIPCTWPR